MNPNNIPAELKARKQWARFHYPDHAKGKKRPMPGYSSTDPSTWETWDQVKDCEWPAFVLSADDPYTMIDMDPIEPYKGEPEDAFVERKARTVALYYQCVEKFPSYLEVSASGNGAHIIGRGVVGPGIDRQGLELYDRDRFCVFTGNVIGNNLEIKDFNQEELNSILSFVRRDQSVQQGSSIPQSEEDLEIISKIEATTRGQMLVSGDPALLHDRSQSEVDHEFIAALTEESGNFEQVHRIFCSSPGPKKRTTPKYVWYTFAKVRGRIESDARWIEDFQSTLPYPKPEPAGPALNGTARTDLPGRAEAPEPVKPVVPSAPDVGIGEDDTDPEILPCGLLSTRKGDKDMGVKLLSTMPDGLLKRLAMMFYWNSRYPIAEIALTAALETWTMAVSRGYQGETATPLNIYLLATVISSGGKNPMVEGVPSFMSKVGKTFQSAHWAGEPRSAAALTKTLKFSPRCIMVKSECGTWMQAMTDEKSQVWEKGAADGFTQLYSAGAGAWTPARTASSEDTDLETIVRPCFSIFGETQPGVLWPSIREQGTVKGFLPRFIILEVDNESVQQELIRPQGFNTALIDEMRDIFVEMARRDHQGEDGQFQLVPLTEEGYRKFKRYCFNCREFLLAAEQEAHASKTALYGKMGENALKLATLVAISRDWQNPKLRVTVEDLDWGISVINHSTKTLLSKLAEQQVEATVSARQELLLKWINKIRNMTWAEKQNGPYSRFYRAPYFEHQPGCIPVALLRNVVGKCKAFTECRNSNEFDLLLNQMIRDGTVLKMVDKKVMTETVGISAACIFVE